MPPTTPLYKKNQTGYAWGEADNGSQTGRREGQNLIKFNKAERIAQTVTSDFCNFFFSFYNLCLLKHFHTHPFICVHSQEIVRTQKETLIPFCIWMLTEDGHHLCKLSDSMTPSPAINISLHFKHNSWITFSVLFSPTAYKLKQTQELYHLH